MSDVLDALRTHLPETVDEALRLLDHQGLTGSVFAYGEDPRTALRQGLEHYLDEATAAPMDGAPGRLALMNAVYHQALLATLERHCPDPTALPIARAIAALAVTRQVAVMSRELSELRVADLRLGGTIAHELRSPLTALHGALNVLGKYMAPPPGAPSARMVEIAINSGSQLVGLIDGLLEAERLTSGEPVLALAACDAGAVLRQAGTMMGASAALADVALEIVPCQATLLADADRLRQALVILLASAIQAAGGGTRVRLQAQVQGDALSVRLSSEAPWPALAALAQPPVGVLSKAELTHMDLMIARLVIERHGGRLWVEAESAVCLSLPIATTADGPLVLVCDEDSGFHEVVEAFLVPRGIRVLGVTDPHAMLALAQAHTPAVILLSEELATAEVRHALRQPGPTAQVPIVRMGVDGAGADDDTTYHLVKPFKKADLIAVIGRAMGAAAGGAP